MRGSAPLNDLVERFCPCRESVQRRILFIVPNWWRRRWFNNKKWQIKEGCLLNLCHVSQLERNSSSESRKVPSIANFGWIKSASFSNFRDQILTGMSAFGCNGKHFSVFAGTRDSSPSHSFKRLDYQIFVYEKEPPALSRKHRRCVSNFLLVAFSPQKISWTR